MHRHDHLSQLIITYYMLSHISFRHLDTLSLLYILSYKRVSKLQGQIIIKYLTNIYLN